ncbi:Ribonuclease/ribotoxin, partial [Bipolaris maydis]
ALLTVSLLAGIAFATPTPSSILEKRDVNCRGTVYSDSQLEACRRTLCLYDNRQGPGGYPHFFANHELLNFGSYTGDLYEYPLVRGSRAYNGVVLANEFSLGAPGPDRCVAAYDAVTGNCDLLGAMTHTGAPANNRNRFFLC